METYSLYKFLHVASAVIWVGSGVGLFALTLRMNRIGDRPGVLAIGRHAEALGKILFTPAALSTLIWGVLMVLTTDSLGFSTTWIVVGLVGIIVSVVIGVGFITPTGARIEAVVQQHGPETPVVDELVGRLLAINAIDLLILFGVIWAMVAKPGA